MTSTQRAEIVRMWLLFVTIAMSWLCYTPPSPLDNMSLGFGVLIFLAMPPLIDCTPATCTRCLSNIGPCGFTVIIIGVTNKTIPVAPCSSNCATQVNGTFECASFSEVGLCCDWSGTASICGSGGVPIVRVCHFASPTTTRNIEVVAVVGALRWRNVTLLTDGTTCVGIDEDVASFDDFTCSQIGSVCHITGFGI